MRKILTILALGISLAAYSSAVFAGDSMPVDSMSQNIHSQDEDYVLGRVIVKFKESYNKCAHCAFAAAKQSGPADSIDELNFNVGVESVRSLFIERHGLSNTEAGNMLQNRFQEIKNRLPHRTKQIPKRKSQLNLTNTYVFTIPEESDIEALCELYRANEFIENAEPDYLMEAYSIPNDTYADPNDQESWHQGSWGQTYADLWGHEALQVEDAWNHAKGEGVIVGVVDSGVDVKHEDIYERIWLNPGEFPGMDDNLNGEITLNELIAHGLSDMNDNGRIDPDDLLGSSFEDGLDNDNNGYVDDLLGWDFANSDNDPHDTHFGHGTHIAGTIAASENNEVGIVGLAPQSRIMALKVFTSSGQGRSLPASAAAEGIIYGAMNGARVHNNSWGKNTSVVLDALKVAYELGVVNVFAAGNESLGVDRDPLMTLKETIVVSALYPNLQFTDFSNLGYFVDVAGPGWEVVSLNANKGLSLVGENCALTEGCFFTEDYVHQGGTSMAAPHVAGIAALVFSKYPDWTQDDFRQVIQSTSVDITDPLGSGQDEFVGFDLLTGFGLVNAAQAVTITNVPKVSISYPEGRSEVNKREGVLRVIGTACDYDRVVNDCHESVSLDFSYQLFYMIPALVETWTPLHEPVFSTHISDDVLYELDTSDFIQTSQHFLKLVVNSSDGNQYEEKIQIKIVDENIVATMIPVDDYSKVQGASGSTFPILLGANDPDGDPLGEPLSFTCTSVPTSALCDVPIPNTSSNEARFLWPKESPGDWDVTVTVTDSQGRSDFASFHIEVRENPSPCFIATAAYGTPMHEDIDVLRKYRDDVMLKSELGAKLVETYYKYSPPIADKIAEREWAKKAVRVALKPVVKAAEWYMQK